MIFKQVDDIRKGRKTQTRRACKPTEEAVRSLFNIEKVLASGRVKWRVGGIYAVVPKRGAQGTGDFIKLCGIRCEHVQDITEADAIAEGVGSVAEYKALWESINGKTKGVRWQDNPLCWVLTFKLVEETKTTPMLF